MGVEKGAVPVLAFVAGIYVGMHWKEIKKFVEPYLKGIEGGAAGFSNEAVKFFMEQKEHVEDLMAEANIKKTLEGAKEKIENAVKPVSEKVEEGLSEVKEKMKAAVKPKPKAKRRAAKRGRRSARASATA
ncbi:MAG: hypothetical protein L6265_10770 [Thermoplasmatales archaeon]|nr:hypothetical protein [Candidatus Thermoplasmatota archaeon]MCG2827059.1 hypothetical protein [Thermoplasmatales archaeon]